MYTCTLYMYMTICNNWPLPSNQEFYGQIASLRRDREVGTCMGDHKAGTIKRVMDLLNLDWNHSTKTLQLLSHHHTCTLL